MTQWGIIFIGWIVCIIIFGVIINIKWNKLDDGLLSMFMANEIYKNTYDNKQSNEKMKSLIEYNEIDCKTMQVLLKFIREF